jgi:uncharacterized OB-fold protein
MNARLIPPSSELTRPYWESAREKKLVVQQCAGCRAWQFPPRRHCAGCGSSELDWRPVSGRGSVYSYTVAHRPPHPVFAGQCPLVIAVVELEEGPRMMTNIVGCNPADVTVGMSVRAAFEPIADSDVVLPVFEPE